jgi:hypothetical protein
MPLLAAWSLVRERRVGKWGAFFLLPLAALAGYQWWTREFYGLPLFSAASNFALAAGGGHFYSKAISLLQSLTFTGGCLAAVMFCAPQIWSWRKISTAAVLTTGGAVAVLAAGMMSRRYPWLDASVRPLVEIQMVFWAVGGVLVLLLAVDDWRRRDAHGWLLALWIVGTFLFAVFFNWTVNGRTILPMAPAVGILLARRLETVPGWRSGIGLAAGVGLALLAARADFIYAATVRTDAQQILAVRERGNVPLWFQGHWGFQAYLEAGGAQAMDLKTQALRAGDRLAIHLQNTSVSLPPSASARALSRFIESRIIR